MPKQAGPAFAEYVYAYFMKYLPLHRGLSPLTVSSYSYSLMLFYTFCKDERGIPHQRLTLERIDKLLVNDYLLWLESTRNNSASTRNQRLSALKSLFQYIQSESVVYTALCCDILSIPEKKTPTIPPKYLSVEEMEILFSMSDIQSKPGRRDLAVATHFACRHGSGFFLSYMAEFWDNEWRVQRVGACHSFFTRGKAKERTPWPASLVRSFSRSYNPDDYTERTAICREIYGDFQGCLPRRIPTCGLPTLQLAG